MRPAMKDKPKHTPGPWRVADDGSIGTILSIDGTVVAQAQQCRPRTHDPLHLERKANARLIAAAPELLEALKSTMNHIKMLEEGIEDLRQLGATAQFCGVSFSHAEAIAAIAKAEGDQP